MLARAENQKSQQISFEIFVQAEFSYLELSSIIAVLQTANDVLNRDLFQWQITSDTPGFVSSCSDLIVRAAPAISDQYLSDCLCVVGGQLGDIGAWLRRVRAMQKLKRPAALFSDAAREYIKATAPQSGPVTAHWRDIGVLREVGDFPTLSDNLVARNGTVLTCAGAAHTAEAVIGILSEVLEPQDRAELACQMILNDVRGHAQEQPKGLSANPNFLEKRLQNAIRIMEENTEHPLPTATLARRVGVSTRQLERQFMLHLSTSPGKFYRKIRLKKALTLVSHSQMPIIDIAIACGFSSTSTLSQTFKAEYGKTPNQLRRTE
ncbi:helix-turn-helix domain-containing protein [Ruegeria sp. R14_0]|uniref:GlxA family transcriptional regulator n=1 Tax=Ruegeria sp. R14_0 TaxID=2821100 RepID=UPI001ADA8DC2|nr:helix-turn-helix domain-containing protein [Ruegeria sp. R14_0]MBO9446716.1 helix-turn-helix domain-containing protein [Ruegeria sp. R14_0]